MKLFTRKLAGFRDAERTVSSESEQKSHLFDFVEFIHTPLWKSKTFLAEKYIEKGYSIAQIALETLSSKSTIRRALVGFKIPIREKGKPGHRPAQAPYGYRRQNGLLVPHIGEQRVVDAVKRMSIDGLSYRKICEFLTGIGVPTKNRGKKWQPEMIRRILNRLLTLS